MNFSIREATQKDYRALCEVFAEGDALHREALPHIFRKTAERARPEEFILDIIADENAALFVAEHNGRIIGLVHVRIREVPHIPILVPRQYASISDLVVKGEFRRSGVGRALVERAERWALDRGASQIELNVWEFNEGAIAFYEKLGYKTISRKLWKSLT
jgi:ribosomal protein S18 acetylase RimI-like enzyme